MFSIKDISEYIVLLIAAFASHYSMSEAEAYRYLSRYGAIKVAHDFWTVSTADGSLSAHEEHTVGILKSGPFVLTGPPETDDEKKMVEQFFERYEKNH